MQSRSRRSPSASSTPWRTSSATLASIYTVNYRSARFRQLGQEELAGGAVPRRCTRDRVPDGRNPIAYLAARVDSATVVARKLREITLESDDDALIRTDRYPPTPTR